MIFVRISRVQFFWYVNSIEYNILAIPLMWKINLFKTDKAVYQYYFYPNKETFVRRKL